MSTLVRVIVCADCLEFSARMHGNGALSEQRAREISEGFSQWREYDFAFGQCSEQDLANDTLCDICRRSLTKERRHHDQYNVALDRRWVLSIDRRGLMADRRSRVERYLRVDRRALYAVARRARVIDRRQRTESDDPWDRRYLPDSNRRTPFGRGCRMLLATLRTS